MKKILFCSLFCSVVWACLAAAEPVSMPVAEAKAVLMPRLEALIAAKIDGTVLRHRFLVGQHFRSGELLTQMDDAHYRLIVARSGAQRQEAATLAVIAADAYEAQKKLYDENMQSKVELDRREAELASANARKKITEAEFAEANLQLGYCRITAPFDGRMEEILVREHETVRNGQPVIRIIGDRELLAVVNLPVRLLPKLQGKLRFRFPEGPGGTEVSGKVFEISPRVDYRSGTIEVKALIDNADGKLTGGMTGVFVDGK